MKKTFYFSHDYGARNDPKLQNLLMSMGVAGLGIYWCIVEQLYEQGGTLPLSCCKSIAFALHLDIEEVQKVINDFSLFEHDDKNFWSSSVNTRLAQCTDIAEKRKKAAFSRWHQPQVENPAPAPSAPEPQKPVHEPAKRFIPPTLQEVQTYILAKGYSIDAEAFVAFYSSKGWFVGKNKMKDWKMALITWEKRPGGSNNRKNNNHYGTTGTSYNPNPEGKI
jgi:hypothetical protein